MMICTFATMYACMYDLAVILVLCNNVMFSSKCIYTYIYIYEYVYAMNEYCMYDFMYVVRTLYYIYIYIGKCKYVCTYKLTSDV